MSIEDTGACFFGDGARFDLAAPPFSPVSRLYTNFTFTVSHWQGRRHGFEGGVQFRGRSERKKLRVASPYSSNVRIEGGGRAEAE